MTTIMEQKIKVLVQSVAQNVAAVVSHSPQLGGSESGVALSKDLVALQRLVGASIAALKNAAAGGGSGSAPATPSANSANGYGGVPTGGSRAPRPQGPPPGQQGDRPLSQSVDSGMPRYGGVGSGAGTLGTPIALPAFPTAQHSFNGTPGGYSNPNLRASYGSQGSANSVGSAGSGPTGGGWGGKDEYYSSGDVFRSVDRK